MPCRYHSHPVFEARPSRKDMDNQRNYQALTRDTEPSSSSCGGACLTDSSRLGPVLEPFVGFILSPFDPALLLPHTSAKAFVVQQRGTSSNLVPYNVRCGETRVAAQPMPAAEAGSCQQCWGVNSNQQLGSWAEPVSGPWSAHTFVRMHAMTCAWGNTFTPAAATLQS
jgi:hypothetical protein